MSEAQADAWLRHHIASSLDGQGLTRLGIAVSGGGDSIALLHLLAAEAPALGVVLEAATVNHGLRPEAADEAAFTAETCRALSIPHETLHWQGWDGHGNLQAEARAARYRLLAAWARGRGLDAVALAHTRDDQAETFLMRLAREAGVDGLAAMDRAFARDGTRFLRPALGLERAALRGFLTRHHHRWCEDPSNDDPRFDRVKARRALSALDALGLDSAALANVAGNLAAASQALKHATADAAKRLARVEAGDVLFDRAGLAAAPAEITRRLLSTALVWVAGSAYAPRRDALLDLDAMLRGAPRRTLHGCLISAEGESLRITREFNAVKDITAPFGSPWDGRWQITGPGTGLTLRALGPGGLADCPDWRATGLPRASLLASPAAWDGPRLVAAPLAGKPAGFSATILPGRDDFVLSCLTH